MKILHIASELAPCAKAGGLGDVVHGLARATQRLGHEVVVLLPKYLCLNTTLQGPPPSLVGGCWTREGNHRYYNKLWETTCEGIPLYLLDSGHPARYFDREQLYGYPDDLARFIYFSRAALDLLTHWDPLPDLVHLHDWPTALLPLLMKSLLSPLLSRPIPSLLTIHNLHHQGLCAPEQLQAIGLPPDPELVERLTDHRHPRLYNLLRGGLLSADALTTVSPTYAREIMTSEGGSGLHDDLKSEARKLHGILNGIDTESWNPSTDPFLPRQYTIASAAASKKYLKESIQKRCGLATTKAPLVTGITRLVTQKAPHLLQHALRRTIERGGPCILLAGHGEPVWEEEFRLLANELEGHPQARIFLQHDEELAHLLYAAADIFLIPSLFEPCGLTQMIALRYGTIPLARRTGGLADTIFDIDTASQPEELRNGFTFDFPDATGVDWALDRALDLWTDHPRRWNELVQRGMQQDFSWNSSASRYEALYKSLI